MTDQEIVAGRGDIAQASGALGLNVYSDWKFTGVLQTFYSFADMGQGSGAMAWLTGDFLGGGLTEIAQLWDNGGNLGLNVYRMGSDTVQTVISSSDLGQGSGAVAWLTGDFTGSGHTEIAQLWDNNGTAGLIVYGFPNATVEPPLIS